MAVMVAIGRLEFDLDGLVLYDRSEVVPLAPLPAQMLAALVRAGGDVVRGRVDARGALGRRPGRGAQP